MGDPRWSPHPVELMGKLIQILRECVESIAGENTFALKFGGLLITSLLLIFSVGSGWLLEHLVLKETLLPQGLGLSILLLGLGSCLASGSLNLAVKVVLETLPRGVNNNKLSKARKNLSEIVGRDTDDLNQAEILRAAAETASENSVDGIFAPLFWMAIGATIWQHNPQLPGPLALGWGYKASSTIDSMIGYKHGRLRWIGASGARLDDVLTWFPCRLVVLTLPLITKPSKFPSIIRAAWQEGSKDTSPNSGLSEAIFAHCLNIKMGGQNTYQGTYITKPTLSADSPEATKQGVERLLQLILKLEATWLISIAIFGLIIYPRFSQ